MLYTIVHTVINNKGEHPEANARVLGVYSNEDVAINALLCMKKLKTEIAELELVMQLKKANEL